MVFPAIDDTIIAVSSGWAPCPLGIVRLSGPQSFGLVTRLGVTPPARLSAKRACCTESRLRLDADLLLPATTYWFCQPRSYTGQDVVELHTVGCLPVLRELCARLIDGGARRALPGEFTARAYLNGKLDAEQVEDVLALIAWHRDSAARRERRARRQAAGALTLQLRARIADLLALVEAGIDFAEEEDVRFIKPREVLAAIDELREMLAEFHHSDRRALHAGKPHIALVGLPNAGKSTLFNRLVGYERAIVSPVLGTTRDVLSVEMEVGGIAVVVQDCAGLGHSEDELELAAHLAAERAAERADLVLWVHPAGSAWDARETRVARRLPPGRRLLVWSKTDLAGRQIRPGLPAGFEAAVATSAVTGAGLPELRSVVCRLVSSLGVGHGGQDSEEHLRAVATMLARARALVREGGDDLSSPELLALELRGAYERISETGNGGVVEEVLGRVFSQFCVGK